MPEECSSEFENTFGGEFILETNFRENAVIFRHETLFGAPSIVVEDPSEHITFSVHDMKDF